MILVSYACAASSRMKSFTVNSGCNLFCVLPSQSLMFKSTYQEEVDYLMTNIGIVNRACREVLDNPRLKEFLVDIILSFGTLLWLF